MKNYILICSFILLTSCGVGQSLSEHCGKDIEMGCNAVFGYTDKDQNEELDEIKQKNKEQDERLTALENQTNLLIDDINNLTDGDEDNEDLINALQNTVNSNVIQIASLQTSLTALDSALSKTIIGVIDPCGNSSGYDEIILKTKDNKYIGYFEQGSKRFLTVLDNGSYVTTDGSNCNFTVTNTGVNF